MLKMAPPSLTPSAVLPEKVQSDTISVALLLKMAPAAPRLLPPEMLMLSSATITPAPATRNTGTVLPPLMVVTPPPSIVVSALMNFVLVRVIVVLPPQLKVTVP